MRKLWISVGKKRRDGDLRGVKNIIRKAEDRINYRGLRTIQGNWKPYCFFRRVWKFTPAGRKRIYEQSSEKSNQSLSFTAC